MSHTLKMVKFYFIICICSVTVCSEERAETQNTKETTIKNSITSVAYSASADTNDEEGKIDDDAVSNGSTLTIETDLLSHNQKDLQRKVKINNEISQFNFTVIKAENSELEIGSKNIRVKNKVLHLENRLLQGNSSVSEEVTYKYDEGDKLSYLDFTNKNGKRTENVNLLDQNLRVIQQNEFTRNVAKPDPTAKTG